MKTTMVIGVLLMVPAVVGAQPQPPPPQQPAAQPPSTPAAQPPSPPEAPEPPPSEPPPVPARAQIRHLPAPQVEAEDPVLAMAVIHPQHAGEIRVLYRTRGAAGDPLIAVATRGVSTWVARLDPERLDPARGLEYWIVEHMPGGDERPVFASADSPHPAAVHESDDARHLREELALREGRRSRAIVRGEYVGLGTRNFPGRTSDTEQYYRIEASYAHAFYTRVEEVRLTIGRLRGNVIQPIPDPELSDERGLDYGSAELTWYLLPLLRVRTSVLFGYSQEGFSMGGGGDVVIGRPDSTSFTVGASGITTVGWTVMVRLGWLTVPRVPMGASIEVGTYPANSETGMRLLYDVGYELYPGAVLRLQGGYRGWNSTTGGPSIGGEVAFAF